MQSKKEQEIQSQKPQKHEFDNFADDYSGILDESISFSGERSSFFIELKIKLLHNYIRKELGIKDDLKILDYGCGTGRSAEFVNKYFPNSTFTGVDPSSKSINVAKKRFGNKKNEFMTLNNKIKLKENCYDVVFSAVTFHHIPIDKRDAALKSIHTSLKQDSIFVLFEHNPYNPLIVKIVKDCPLDKNAILLKLPYSKRLLRKADFKIVKSCYYFFFPKCLSFLRFFEKYIQFLPLGGQYMLIGRK
jgi:ubiquinone/menaquinone biosynthesis C-methylase UbiE